MKRLKKDMKADILLATRDAMFQQIADHEETMTDEACEEAFAELERRKTWNVDTETSVAIEKTIKKEINAIFGRIFEATKKGEDN